MTAIQPRLNFSKDVLAFVGFLVLCFAVSAISAYATASSVGTWYATLNKPSFNPPNWIFGPVWTVLYTFMAIAAWRVWRQNGLRGAEVALTLFFIQLALNFFWSLIFFGMQRPGLALIDIILLLVVIDVTLIVFWRRDRLAGLLFVPYAAWVTFAAILNAAIWRLN